MPPDPEDNFIVGFQRPRARTDVQGSGVDVFMYAGSPTIVIATEQAIERRGSRSSANASTSSFVFHVMDVSFGLGVTSQVVAIPGSFYSACAAGSIRFVAGSSAPFLSLMGGVVSGSNVTVRRATAGSPALTATILLSGTRV